MRLHGRARSASWQSREQKYPSRVYLPYLLYEALCNHARLNSTYHSALTFPSLPIVPSSQRHHTDEALFVAYKERGSVERGFRVLKDPLFLASSVFVKKPNRLMVLSFIMVLCLLIYRPTEHRLRQRLQQSEQTLPNQVNKPTAKPTMRWVFQCFEGIELLHIRIGSTFQAHVLRL